MRLLVIMIWCVYAPYIIHRAFSISTDFKKGKGCDKMKKRMVLFLLTLTLLSGCGKAKTQKGPVVCVPVEDCFLCGREEVCPWGQNNIGLISLNSFELMPIGINRYDDNGELIEESTGTFRLRGHQSEENGFCASAMEESDHGHALVSLTLGEDIAADRERAGGFLCEECLERILPEGDDTLTGLGAVDLLTGEVKALDKNAGGFGLGDFYLHCDWKKDGKAAELFLFYSPLRYGVEE